MNSADPTGNTGVGDPPAAGGWGTLREVASVLRDQGLSLRGPAILLKQNKADGFGCVSCAWAKPREPHAAEFCASGAKATAWELTDKRLQRSFFEDNSLAALRALPDHLLEAGGRLTDPMRWDSTADRYVPVTWDQAFEGIGRSLRRLRQEDPQSVVFYASGRASLEASYMYQLLARLYGNNNLPDSSNMCHESTSVALPKTIGVPVGTVTLDDFEHTDAIFFFGQNAGTNSPRMLHQLKDVRDRGKPIVTFNPLRESGLVRFVDPQSPLQMLTPSSTAVSTQYLQLKNGGDLAAVTGLCKRLIEWDDAALAAGTSRPLDVDFIEQHTHGFDAFASFVRGTNWDEIEQESGLTRAALSEAAQVFASAKSVICVYGMGLTQHRKGVQNVQMLSNLLLLGGHIGRLGAGICPVRGHSNVQGQRTVGITEKPELAPLDKLEELYGFEAPRKKGLNTVETCEGVLAGTVKAFVGLGGNFLRAIPETARVEAAWPDLELTVHVATKLNRTHLLPGREAYLLPCLGRIEIDRQGTGDQHVSYEDSTGFMHGSIGVHEPAATSLRSEPDIVANLAVHALPPNARVPWKNWVADYSKVRDAIEATWPAIFSDFNTRFLQPGGFQKPIPARQRVWKTDTGKANFIVPDGLRADPDMPADGPHGLRLMTIRSEDQFNTTIYSLDDRLRGLKGSRLVLLMNASDIARLGLDTGENVIATTVSADGFLREVGGLLVTPYDIPPGCVAGYFPELNPLVPLWHHAEGSQVPASKAIPIRLRRDAGKH